MEKVLVEFKDANGDPIYVETNVGMLDKKFISAGKPLQEATGTFEKALQPIVTMANSAAERLKSIAVKPDTVELEFGIKLSGTVDAWVITGSGEGTITLKLTWESDKKNK